MMLSAAKEANTSNLVKRLRSMSGGNQNDEGYSLIKHDDAGPTIEIYRGSKNFWRLRRNVDLNFVYHPKYDCIEVIGYDPQKETHAPRVYLSASILAKKCKNTQTFMEKVESKKPDLKKKPLCDTAPYAVLEANMLAEMSRDFISQHILQRLDVVDTTPAPVPIVVPQPEEEVEASGDTDDMDGEGAAARPEPVIQYAPVIDSFEVKFQPIGSDLILPAVTAPPPKKSTRASRGSFGRDRSGSRDDSADETEVIPGRSSFTLPATPATITLDWVLAGPPEGLEPHIIPRRKKTSTNDFLATLSLLQADQTSLERANKEAERRLKLTKMATDSFNCVMGRFMKKRKYLSKCSPARVRWINAINRVLTQNLVAALTKRINAIPESRFKQLAGGSASSLTSTTTTGARAAPLKALPHSLSSKSAFQPSLSAVQASPSGTPRSPLTLRGKTAASQEDPNSAAPSPRGVNANAPTGGLIANSGGMLDSPRQKGKKALAGSKSSITKTSTKAK